MNCFGLSKKKSTNFNIFDKLKKLKNKKYTLSNANSCEELKVSHFIVETSDVNYFDEDDFSSKLPETFAIEMPERKTSVETIHLQFDPSKMKHFLDQNIGLLRSELNENRSFEDEQFLRDVSSIVEEIESGLGLSLSTRFKTKNLNELDNLIKWQRTKVFLIFFNL